MPPVLLCVIVAAAALALASEFELARLVSVAKPMVVMVVVNLKRAPCMYVWIALIGRKYERFALSLFVVVAIAQAVAK